VAAILIGKVWPRNVFKGYILDNEFRTIVNSGQFAMLNVSEYGEDFRRLPADLRKKMTEYIMDNVPLNMFMD
jgi:type I restriction enzyme R subunit